ncbi:transposase family protein [Streptomyces sp. NPDC085529]|uniref:transposase family protein n=1 Tax=Streptomyces sp. NPDC085529 TaxID=3365729 RepID=UPI0037D856BE
MVTPGEPLDRGLASAFYRVCIASAASLAHALQRLKAGTADRGKPAGWSTSAACPSTRAGTRPGPRPPRGRRARSGRCSTRGLKGLGVDAVGVVGDAGWIGRHARQPTVACPSCGVTASRVHSTYMRRLADRPLGGRRVLLRLRIRRFFCDDSPCSAGPWRSRFRA